MRVFKFGGASVKDATGVRNLAKITKTHSGDLVIVISAMGKTTNALEEIVNLYFNHDKRLRAAIDELRNFHIEICCDLWKNKTKATEFVDTLLQPLLLKTKIEPSLNYDFEYDQIVCFGEILSTKIVSHFLNQSGVENQWIDIRKILKTDNTYREANIDWNLTKKLIAKQLNFTDHKLYITQGFLGATTANITTSLGREGSDYTAAVIANILEAKEAVIWKDVPGILNADPTLFPETVKLDEISYREAIEMTFAGAKVIHPKTLKPLENKQIPLHVKSFIDPHSEGTIIQESKSTKSSTPIFIIKQEQVLLSISPKDLSFVQSEAISIIFSILANHRVKVNLVQHSAVSFSIVVDTPERDFDILLSDLNEQFDVRYNRNLQLATIRHYNTEAINHITNDKQVFVEQITRNSARFLLK